MRKPGRFTIYLGSAESFVRQFTLTTLIAVVIPIITGYVAEISTIEQIFLGLFLFTLGMLIQVNNELTKLRGTTLRHMELWSAQNEADRLLGNARADYALMLQRGETFFARYFDLKFRRLADEVFRARAGGDLQVDQDFDTTDMMLRDFSGQDGHVIRAVHFLSDNEFLFGVHPSHFFCDVAALVSAGRIKEVRRLMVVSDESDLQDARTRRLVAFHHGSNGFDYRLIRKRDFDRINRDFNIPTDTHDFGIYASWYVYRSVVSTDSEIKGRFNSDAEAIRKFSGAFDRSWTSDLAYKTQSPPANAPTLSELFGRDAVSPNRPGVPQVIESAAVAPKLIGAISAVVNEPPGQSTNDA